MRSCCLYWDHRHCRLGLTPSQQCLRHQIIQRQLLRNLRNVFRGSRLCQLDLRLLFNIRWQLVVVIVVALAVCGVVNVELLVVVLTVQSYLVLLQVVRHLRSRHHRLYLFRKDLLRLKGLFRLFIFRLLVVVVLRLTRVVRTVGCVRKLNRQLRWTYFLTYLIFFLRLYLQQMLPLSQHSKIDGRPFLLHTHAHSMCRRPTSLVLLNLNAFVISLSRVFIPFEYDSVIPFVIPMRNIGLFLEVRRVFLVVMG